MQVTNTLSCRQFTDLLIRHAEHIEDELIKDVQPIDGEIGHYATAQFPAYAGTEHTFDRLNRVFPDLSGPWQDVVASGCFGTPCDPTAKKIGMGSTRDSFKLQQKSWETPLFCFDLILSADRAKDEFSNMILNLRNATNIIVSDRLKTEYIRISDRKVVADAFLTPITYTEGEDTIVPSSLPTSLLTISMLQRLVYPLMINGYLGSTPDMPPMFELATDMITAQNLREGNPTLANMVQFRDFVAGGALFKYGITDSIGNFAIRIDKFPPRYQLLADGVTLQRVHPYRNVPTTNGIRSVENEAYTNARYQWSRIHHRMAMTHLTREVEQLNSMMPFATRDFGGKWQFVMDNLGADEHGCVINNERRNKGKFIADFQFATKAAHPEWAVGILHMIDPGCIVEIAPCSPDPGYVEQDYSSANDVCPIEYTFDLQGAGPFTVGDITCNGVLIDHDDLGSLADVDALVEALNDSLSSLGTWSSDSDTTIKLTGSTCNSVTVDITSA
jgi:hypothetical protein